MYLKMAQKTYNHKHYYKYGNIRGLNKLKINQGGEYGDVSLAACRVWLPWACLCLTARAHVFVF